MYRIEVKEDQVSSLTLQLVNQGCYE